jgi:hypothetical protein
MYKKLRSSKVLGRTIGFLQKNVAVVPFMLQLRRDKNSTESFPRSDSKFQTAKTCIYG